ncbi:alpha-amylase family glycosyl hydrolase [Lachnoclostridium sp. Marseille-P6806]|uniref:alpha-amylase family glycosyl hydrolase n=1 Tax=Lachnoclostridium sp. Marseille-P6806 TaxID=2364793 RepID=UPI00102F61AB|nr:alpha-amylase family glycosyl hydrolase [Lachnoclostridium sp. Marseille-P6806]
MWADESVFYHIYPLGMCGAPLQNDGVEAHRIREVLDYIPHLVRLGVGAVYFGPVFESDAHGYDTRDYRRIDVRLGTNEDFREICDALHKAGIRVVLDAVFNHVGRGFGPFRDVQEHRRESSYKNWFHISFDGDSAYHDGFWYDGWEGHYELVKLNLREDAVVQYLLDTVRFWTEEFGIDGLRLDVAYCLDRDFLRRLRRFTDELKPDFWMVGEILGGDYKTIMADDMLHSATNYECYKGLFSSFNSMNMFEINHSLQRQFGSEPWCLYRGKNLLTFVDNHDVTRVASILSNPAHLPLIYALAFGMPGIPCIYYGSEWGLRGDKKDGDPALRVPAPKPEWTELTDFIRRLSEARRGSEALCFGDFRSILLTNRQCIFERRTERERVLVAINADGADFMAHFDAGCGTAEELLTGKTHDFGGGSLLPAYSAAFWRMER